MDWQARRLPFHTRDMVLTMMLAMAAACLSDPSGSFANRLVLGPEALAFEALGDSARVSVAEFAAGGTALPTPVVEYASGASAVVEIDSTGLVVSRGNGVTWIIARSTSGAIDSSPVTVVQQPAAMVAAGDTLQFHALGAELPLGALVVDRLGAPIVGLHLEYVMADTSIAGVTGDGRVIARRNGTTIAQISGVGESLSVVIHVEQIPVRVVLVTDTIRFVALGEPSTATGIAVDSLDHPVVAAGVSNLTVLDTAVLAVLDSVTVRSKQNGQTEIRFSVGGLPVKQQAVVTQVPETIIATFPDTLPIVSIDPDSLVPIQCEVQDRNGFAIPIEPSVDPSSSARWTGTTCHDLHGQHSGIDTLVLRAGAVTTSVPLALALRPVVSAPLGQFLAVDSLPVGARPWAPTLLRNATGELELYVTGYVSDSTDPNHDRGHLHRLRSLDGGLTFQYEGIALQRDDSLCTLTGSGIENIAIVPRSDGPGWRMYYAAGSFGCYGWQVFSAVSVDRQSWTKEIGVRLSNGGAVPPDAPVTPPWPVGEGMVVEPLEGIGWRMLVGGYRHLETPEDKFHIIEWRSTDQLTWTYVGPVLTTDDLPQAGQRSVYSPTIREFSPGLWRMIMTADNLRDPGGRSRLWSAVSTDKTHWVLEGELIGAEGTNLYYSTLVDELLVFLRADVGQPRRLASVTVAMP